SRRPHPQGSQRSHRPFDLDVRRGGPASEGRSPQRNPDRGVAAATRDGIIHNNGIVGWDIHPTILMQVGPASSGPTRRRTLGCDLDQAQLLQSSDAIVEADLLDDLAV